MHPYPTGRLALRGAILALTTLVMTACGNASAPDPADSADASASPTVDGVAPQHLPAGMGSSAADGEFPRTVTHFGGETVLKAEPERVVVISTGQLDGVLALGVMPVGTTAAAGAAAVPQYLFDAFPDDRDALTSLPSVGLRLDPDLEAVAALRPDLILINTVGAEQIGAALTGLAPTVVTEGTGVNWQQDLLLVGAALGKQQQAADLLTSFLADAADLGAQVGTTSVSLVRITADSPRVFGVGSFVGSIAAAAGLTRPPAQQFPETSQDLSLENVDLAAGDIIFYSVQQGAEGSPVLASSLWQELPSLADGSAVRVDDDPWYLSAGPVAARLVLDQLTDTLS